nr:MAG TPA: hypothetical protein [Caudoviricetes sp.]
MKHAHCAFSRSVRLSIFQAYTHLHSVKIVDCNAPDVLYCH